MKVLLFANIGSDENGFYHVGDEAMFYETYRWYKKTYPKTEITSLSSLPNNPNLNIVDITIPISFWSLSKRKSIIYFSKLVVKFIFFHFFKKNYFADNEFLLVSLINKQDRIHFSGGGNLASLFPNWLYFAFFIIFIGTFLKKQIVLTSQTIGPFWGIDRLFALFILNFPTLIAVRQKTYGKNVLLKYGVFRPKIVEALDASYTLSTRSIYQLRKNTEAIRIGLSLCRWKSYDNKLIDAVTQLMKRVSNKFRLEVLVIPHVIVRNEDECDTGFMKKIIARFPKKIKVITPTYNQLMNSSVEPAMTIKYLTSKMNLLISSRYHGLIFALSSNVPCLALSMGEYYQIKMVGALKFFYENGWEKYLVSLDKKNSHREIVDKTIYLLSQLRHEKDLLKRINQKISRTPRLLFSSFAKY